MLTPLLQSAIVFKLGVEQVSICFRICARQDALDNLQDSKYKLDKIAKFRKIDGEDATYGSGVLFSLKGYVIISCVFSCSLLWRRSFMFSKMSLETKASVFRCVTLPSRRALLQW